MNPGPAHALTLVIDIGKTRAKLLLVGADGEVAERLDHPNVPRIGRLGYAGLDVEGLESWMKGALTRSAMARHCRHVIASTHGAAFVGLTPAGELAWDPLDYEATQPTDDAEVAARYAAARDPVADTGAPDLPAGLNAARQLDWLQQVHPGEFARACTILPYPQYWAWRLSAIAANEASSLGCHTQMWLVHAGRFSRLAQSRGWPALFPPMRHAWDVLGAVGPRRAAWWGLAAHCKVHVGVHDSNACLARYLHVPGGGVSRFTQVSSGTWTILMASGLGDAAARRLDGGMWNTDIEGRVAPTARFMGGRMYGRISADAADADLDVVALREIVARRIQVLPEAAAGGQPAGDGVRVRVAGVELARQDVERLPRGLRSTLAALFCAQVTSLLDHGLWQDQGEHALIVDGPFSGNRAYLRILQALDPARPCHASIDEMEGTARGAWMLCDWPARAAQARLQPVQKLDLVGLRAYDQEWRRAFEGLAGRVGL